MMPQEDSAPDTRLARLEKTGTGEHPGRWRKTLSSAFPAADYWLCHEARLFQEFGANHPYVARFLSVDVENRTLVVEASGHTLLQLLNTHAEELQHPFQRSSDLIRLIRGTCKAVASLHSRGVIHGGLRLDNILIGLTPEKRVDFESVKLIDFAAAHSPLHRPEKPPFLDPAGEAAAHLSEAQQKALRKDWENFARLVGEEGKDAWSALSDKARRRYPDTLMPTLESARLDWRADLYSLSHWFRQLSLRRIDYFSDDHQERLPKLLKKMQKPGWQGGFSSMEAVLKELETFELDARSPQVSGDPALKELDYLAPLPAQGLEHTPPAASPQEAPPPVAEVRPLPSLAGNRVHPAFAGNGRPSENRAKTAPAPRGNKEKRFPWFTWKKALLALVALAWVGAWVFASRTPPTKPEPEVKLPATAAEETSAREDAQPAAKNAARPAPEAAPQEAKPAPAKNGKDSLEDLRAQAVQGNPAAQTRLGLLYREGKGVKASNEDAVKWFRKAADQGYAEAQGRLGFMLMTGRGVKKDDAEALKWFKKSADQGFADAQYNLGLLYMNGRGTTANAVEAYKWYRLAAASGSSGAREGLRTLQKQMNERDKLEAERLADEWKANHGRGG